MSVATPLQGCADGGLGEASCPQCFQIYKKVGQQSTMLQEGWPQYCLWPFSSVFSNNSWSIGQNVPPQQKVSRHITAPLHIQKSFGTPLSTVNEACQNIRINCRIVSTRIGDRVTPLLMYQSRAEAMNLQRKL